MASTKQHNFILHLRPHTAKVLKHHCKRILDDGTLVLRDGTLLGSLVWSQMLPVPLPVECDYEELSVLVPVKLAARYKKGIEWRYTFWHIDRPGMKRIDRWLDDFLTWSMYASYITKDQPNRQAAVRFWMDLYDITEDELKPETAYMDLRRKESDAGSLGMLPNMPSLV